MLIKTEDWELEDYFDTVEAQRYVQLRLMNPGACVDLCENEITELIDSLRAIQFSIMNKNAKTS